MAFKYVYEQDVIPTGWPDDGGGGMTMPSWFDHDIAADVIIPLSALDPGLFIDDDVFFSVPPVTTEILPELFIEEDVFFHPMSVRALKIPGQMLRNEVRRVR